MCAVIMWKYHIGMRGVYIHKEVNKSPVTVAFRSADILLRYDYHTSKSSMSDLYTRTDSYIY